jgi:hypothetical protein
MPRLNGRDGIRDLVCLCCSDRVGDAIEGLVVHHFAVCTDDARDALAGKLA